MTLAGVAAESFPLQPAARSRPRAELVLGALAIASLALIPVRITTIYSGLPAHPLFLHIPVILIPVAAMGALAFAARPGWIERYGIAVAALTVGALAATVLTVGAGLALSSALHLNGGGTARSFGPGALVARHAHAALILRALMIAFTAAIVLTVFAHRIAAEQSTGEARSDRVFTRARTLALLRAVVAVLAVACVYFVFHTGDLGAKAVWQGRLGGRSPFGGAGAPPFGSPSGFAAPGANRTPTPASPSAP